MNKIKLISLFTTTFSLIFLINTRGNEIYHEKDESRISVVVIDPGHGGKDWGASVGSAKEKDIVLDIALQLGNTIKTNYPEIEIVYTRSKDIFIPLHQRANIANKSEADLFISIHVNAVEQKWVKGTETFVLGQHRSKDNLDVAKKENAVILLEDDYNKTYEGFDPNLPESYIMFELVQDEYLEQSVMFASDIQNQFREHANRVDRSVKQSGFLVLRRTTMPSVLIETGFISNATERAYLTSKQGKNILATAIFTAFIEYKKKIEDKSSFNLITEKITIKTAKEETNSAKTIKPEIQEQPTIKKTSSSLFSVQIMALKNKMEITPENFKGEENVFVVESIDYYRYYTGKFHSLAEAKAEKLRIQKKYTNAFVVAFEKNQLISVKKASGKR